MWKRTTGQELQATTGGKPTKLTYEHAERLLLAQANHPEILPPGSHEVQKLGCTFMVSLLFYAWCGMAPASPACLPVCPLRQAPCRMPLLPAPHTRPQLGDNPESDIAGGNAAGFSTIVRSCFSLVFTLCAIPAEPLLLGPLLIAAYSLSGRACSAARTTTTSTPPRRCSRTSLCVSAKSHWPLALVRLAVLRERADAPAPARSDLQAGVRWALKEELGEDIAL